MKKFAVICGLLAMCAFVGCDDDKDSSNGGSNGGGSSSGGIVQVPAGQNNTVGAACNYETFVESCDGNKVVYCGENESGASTVISVECEASCVLTEASGLNFATCSEWLTEVCPKEGDKKYQCDVDEDGVLGQFELKCQKWSDGKLHWYAINDKACTECSDTANGCIQKTCTASDTKCSDDFTGQMCFDNMLYTLMCEYVDEDAMCDDEDGVYCL